MERLGNRTTTTFNEVSGYNGPVVGVMTEEEMGGEVYPKKPKDVLSDGESSFFKEPKWEGVSHTPLIEFSRLETSSAHALDKLIMERVGEEYDALYSQLGKDNTREAIRSWGRAVSQNRFVLALGIVALTTLTRVTGSSSVGAEGLSNVPNTSQNSDPQREGEGGLLEHPENPNYLMSCNGPVPEEIKNCEEFGDWEVHRNNENGKYYQCKPSIPWGVRLWLECEVETRAWDPVAEHPGTPGAYLVCKEEADAGGCGQDPYEPGTVHKNEGDGEYYYCDSHPEKGGVWRKCDTVGIGEEKPGEELGIIEKAKNKLDTTKEKISSFWLKNRLPLVALGVGLSAIAGALRADYKRSKKPIQLTSFQSAEVDKIVGMIARNVSTGSISSHPYQSDTDKACLIAANHPTIRGQVMRCVINAGEEAIPVNISSDLSERLESLAENLLPSALNYVLEGHDVRGPNSFFKERICVSGDGYYAGTEVERGTSESQEIEVDMIRRGKRKSYR